MAKERIVINVKARCGIGKTGVCQVIRQALRDQYGQDVDVVAEELDADIRQIGEENVHHPKAGNVSFIITEELQPL